MTTNGQGSIGDPNIVDLESGDEAESGQHASANVNGHSPNEVDMIVLSSDDDTVSESDDSSLEGLHSKDLQERVHRTPPMIHNRTKFSPAQLLGAENNTQSEYLSLELLNAFDESKRNGAGSSSGDDAEGFLLGVQAHRERHLSPPANVNGNEMPTANSEYSTFVRDHHIEAENRQSKLSADIRETNLKKRQGMEDCEDSPVALKSKSAKDPSPSASSLFSSTTDSIGDSGPESQDTDLGVPFPPATELPKPSHDKSSPPIHGEESTQRIVAEPESALNIPIEDNAADLAFLKRFKRAEKISQKRTTRFLGYDVIANPASEGNDIVLNRTSNGLHRARNSSQRVVDSDSLLKFPTEGDGSPNCPKSGYGARTSRLPEVSTQDQLKTQPSESFVHQDRANQSQTTGSILSRLPNVSNAKEEKNQINKHLSDLRCIKLAVEETAKLRCLLYDDPNMKEGIKRILDFTNGVLDGKVYTSQTRRKTQDIKDNMRRRICSTTAQMSEQELRYYSAQIAEDQLPKHATSVLGGTIFTEIVGAIGVAEERQKLLSSQRENQQKRAYSARNRRRKIPEPRKKQSERQLCAYNTAEEPERDSTSAAANQVIELSNFSDNENEVSSDEDEEPEEYATRKRRAQETHNRERNEERALNINAQLRAEEVEKIEERRRADIEAQEASRGSFNAARAFPPGSDSKRVYQEHMRQFDEDKSDDAYDGQPRRRYRGKLQRKKASNVPPAGLILAGQGRLPTPTTPLTEDYSESEESAVTSHRRDEVDDHMSIDSDSESAISIAEECFEYQVKGQKYNPSFSSSDNEDDERIYRRCLSLSDAHAFLGTLLSRIKISRRDASGGARVTSDLSPAGLNVVDQTVTFLGSGKMVRFWIEKRQVYAEGKASRKAFAPRLLYQVQESRTVTVPAPAPAPDIDEEDLFNSPPPPPPPTVTTTTTTHPAVYTTISAANRAASDTFLTRCKEFCTAPAFLDRQRDRMLAKLEELEVDDVAFDEKKAFSTMAARKGVEGQGGRGEVGAERTEEIRAWVAEVEVVGPRN